MKKRIITKSECGNFVESHVLRNLETIYSSELEEFGKCLFCSLYHRVNSPCDNCKKEWLYELEETD